MYESTRCLPPASILPPPAMAAPLISPPPAKLVRAEFELPPSSHAMMRTSCSPPKSASQLPSPNQTTIQHMYNNGVPPMIYDHSQHHRFEF
uniref:Uncharacterized protein n=1 Tax=Caenorhabditis japonica TaxID=281687 RepID=A0A8R1E488_CAEJA